MARPCCFGQVLANYDAAHDRVGRCRLVAQEFTMCNLATIFGPFDAASSTQCHDITGECAATTLLLVFRPALLIAIAIDLQALFARERFRELDGEPVSRMQLKGIVAANGTAAFHFLENRFEVIDTHVQGLQKRSLLGVYHMSDAIARRQ